MYRFAISKPITTLMFTLAILFFGYTQRQKMPETYLPNVDIPVVTVMTTYKNGSAEVIESKITDKVEEVISSISELESVSSNTSRGISVVVAQFKLTKSIEDKNYKITLNGNRVKNDDEALIFKGNMKVLNKKTGQEIQSPIIGECGC